MNTKQLKSKILDLAIHGKLVPQNPNDEPASKLLEKIREEKQKLIAEKKIKADKNDSYIFVGDDNRHYEKFADGTMKDIEDEIPFEVPKGWEWGHFKDICTVFGRIGFRGYTRDDLVNKGEGAVSLSPSNLINMKLNFEDCTYLSWYKYEESPEIQLNINDIVVVKTGSSYGKAALVDILPEKTTLNPQLMVLKQLHCNSKYLCYLLNTQYMKKSFEDLVNGTAIPTFSQEKFGMKYFPLPPAKEQNVIVAKIEEIFAQIDSLEKDKSDLQSTIKQAKSKILDLAIHGKLVPQDSSDEPAYVLLERLRAEKEAKIKAGELKRNKNDSYIYKNTTDNCYYQKFVDGSETDISDEIPFEIPDNWNWCNLGEIYSHTTGKALKKENNKGTLRKYITTSNLYWNCFDFTDVRTMYFTDDELEKCTIKKGDLVLCNGGDVGRAAIWKSEEDICYQNHVSRLRPKLSGINNSFYLYVIQINKEKGNLSGKGVGITSLSATDILNLKIPLPPLAEQKRIVEKIENAFAKLDQISEQLA